MSQFISKLTRLIFFNFSLIFSYVKGPVFLSHVNKELHCLSHKETNMRQNTNFFKSLKTSGECGNTLNRPASDSSPLLWEKSTYFLSVRLAICLLEGLLTQSTCCCMCSQSTSPKKTVELKCKCKGQRECFLSEWWGGVCVHVHACVYVWRT